MAGGGTRVDATTDGGSQWSAGSLPTGVSSVSGISCAAVTTCTAVGTSTAGSGVALGTTNGGTTGRSSRCGRAPSGTVGRNALQSVAALAGGVSGRSTPVTVTVDNTVPTTTVLRPANAATLSGSQYLDASAGPSVTKVAYVLSGGPSNLSDVVTATATPTYFGWLAAWDTTSVSNGTDTLQSVAYAGAVKGTSPPITVTIGN